MCSIRARIGLAAAALSIAGYAVWESMSFPRSAWEFPLGTGALMAILAGITLGTDLYRHHRRPALASGDATEIGRAHV